MLIPLSQNLSAKQANTYGLILSAAGIYYQTQKDGARWQIRVHDHDAKEALFHIRKYRQENPKFQNTGDGSILEKIQFINGIWGALIILAAYIAVGDDREFFTVTFGASASKIVAGEGYRVITALLLHADAAHLAGNMAALAFFGSVACAFNGAGVGWLMILFSGALGNYINAWVYQSHHTSIGASTAVFGAVGMMATYQFWRKIKQPDERIKAWLPIAGGIALLGIFGAGEGRVDIMAHLFGFACGVLIQSGYQGLAWLWQKQVLPLKYQVVCLGVSLLLLGMSCVRPFLMNPG